MVDAGMKYAFITNYKDMVCLKQGTDLDGEPCLYFSKPIRDMGVVNTSAPSVRERLSGTSVPHVQDMRGR